MATLEDFKKGLRDLSESELRDLMLDLRTKRRTSNTPKVTKKKAASKKKAPDLSNITPDMAKQLLELLEGEE